MCKMVNNVPSKYFRDKGLLPFQVEFVQSFLENEDLPFRELVSPVGTGKIRTAVALIAYEMEVCDHKRFLVLSRNVLLNQWKSELISMLSSERQAITPLIVDRKTYLDLELSVSPGESPWPTSCIVLMSIDFAKRDDIASSIMNVVWDLVIFDESHLLRRKRRVFFDLLKKSGAASRALLLTNSPSHLRGVAVSQVKYGDVVDWDERPLFPSFEKRLISIWYHRTNQERIFLAELLEFARSLGGMQSFGELYEIIITRNAASSIYAVEGMLRRFKDAWNPVRNRMAHGVISSTEDTFQKVQQKLITVTDLLGDSDDILADIDQRRVGMRIQPDQFSHLFNKLESLLDQIQDIGTDSKLDSLIGYLQGLHKMTDKTHICIWTSFRSTAQYLSSNLRDLKQSLYMMTGILELAERQNVIEDFRENGGILITTDASLTGIELEFVDKCINYDLPANPNIFEQRWGRFLRLGRISNFEMVVLRDESNSLPWEEKLAKTIEDTLLSEGSNL